MSVFRSDEDFNRLPRKTCMYQSSDPNRCCMPGKDMELAPLLAPLSTASSQLASLWQDVILSLWSSLRRLDSFCWRRPQLLVS